MRYCRQCGNPMEDGMRFCGVCGAPTEPFQNVQAPVTPKPVKPASGKSHIGLIVTLVLLLLVLIAAAAMLLPGLLSEKPEEVIEPVEENVVEKLPSIQWNLDENGVLTISGKGDMQDYDPAFEAPPWVVYHGAVRSIVVEEGISSIGDYAFAGFESLTNVILPQSLTRIGEKSFANCVGMYTVYIPAGVTLIEEAAFRGCDSLAEFNVDGRNLSYCSIDGALLNKSCTVFIQLPAGANKTDYYIPASVTEIEAGAFYGCRKLSSVTIPGSVREIKELTFCGCTAMTQIVLPMSVRIIRPSAFTEKVYGAGGTSYIGCTAMKKIHYDGLEEWFYSMSVGPDNDNLYNAALYFVDPWDMPQSTIYYFETEILNR